MGAFIAQALRGALRPDARALRHIRTVPHAHALILRQPP
jgi:hypothetical protein